MMRKKLSDRAGNGQIPNGLLGDGPHGGGDGPGPGVGPGVGPDAGHSHASPPPHGWHLMLPAQYWAGVVFGSQHGLPVEPHGSGVGEGDGVGAGAGAGVGAGAGAGVGPEVGHSQAVPPPHDWHRMAPGQYCAGDALGLQHATLVELHGAVPNVVPRLDVLDAALPTAKSATKESLSSIFKQ